MGRSTGVVDRVSSVILKRHFLYCNSFIFQSLNFIKFVIPVAGAPRSIQFVKD